MKKILLFAASLLMGTGLMAQTYYVAGNGHEDPNGNFCDGLNWNASGSQMHGDPATITFENVGKGTYQFKITPGSWDQDWGASSYTGTVVPGIDVTGGGGNMKFTIPVDSDITIVFDGQNITSLTSTGGFGEVQITVYTVVGDEMLTGVDNDPAATQNDMEYNEEGGYWEKIFEGVAAGSHNYKVVGNHSYAVYEYPGPNNSQQVMVDTAEPAYVHIKFREATSTEEAELVAGVNEEPVFGSPSSVKEINSDVELSAANGTIYCSAANFQIYNLVGVNVTAQNGQLSGIYIVKYGNNAATIAVK